MLQDQQWRGRRRSREEIPTNILAPRFKPGTGDRGLGIFRELCSDIVNALLWRPLEPHFPQIAQNVSQDLLVPALVVKAKSFIRDARIVQADFNLCSNPRP